METVVGFGGEAVLMLSAKASVEAIGRVSGPPDDRTKAVAATELFVERSLHAAPRYIRAFGDQHFQRVSKAP